MLTSYAIEGCRLVERPPEASSVFVYTAPTEEERTELAQHFGLEEHDVVSALDPDELPRVEFEDDHAVVIFKRPKNYSSEDNFLFKVVSTGFFLFADRLVVVMQESLPLFDHKVFGRVASLRELMLKMLFRFVHHFFEHLKVIQMVTDALEQKISTAMENRYLLNLFTLEKSLVYYVSALQGNTAVIEKLRLAAAKLPLQEAEREFLEDLTIENRQCFNMARMYSDILASMMDARASIVNNNLNVLMKNLTLVTLAFASMTFVVSAFSMNVPLPFGLGDWRWSFWFVMGLVAVTIALFLVIMRRNRW